MRGLTRGAAASYFDANANHREPRSMRIVECVPNFSEGRDAATIDAIAEAIRNCPGVKLLNVDAGSSTNRTVMTFVGDPDAVVEAAFQGAATAYQRIDMTRHTGEHPPGRWPCFLPDIAARTSSGITGGGCRSVRSSPRAFCNGPAPSCSR